MTHMVLCLRHSDQVIRVRTSSTCECDGEFTQAKGLRSRGSEVARRSLRHFAASSVPLPSAGPSRSGAVDASRGQEGVYCEAIGLADPKSSPASSTGRRHHQPMGGSCAGALLEPASRPGLSPSASVQSVAKINMCMIVSPRKRSRRCIAGWCTKSLRASPLPK